MRIGLNQGAILRLAAVSLIVGWIAVCVPNVADSAAAPQPSPDESGIVHTVTASVEYSTDRTTGKPVMLVPGEFKVPEGFVAGQFRYRWADRKTGRESNRITATTVYSITQRRYMSELKDNPNATLPPGDYKLVVGGLPGAIGNLTYRLMPRADSPGPSGQAGDRIIDVETWTTKPLEDGYHPKFKATYVIRQGQVTGSIDHLVEPPKYGHGITCDPLPYKGTFTGRIEGNVITGKWEEEVLPHKMRYPTPQGTNNPPYDRTASWTVKYEIRLTLHPDGTVSQTSKGQGEMRYTWGPTAWPEELRNKNESHRFDFEIPSKDSPDPLTGRWKERPAGRSAATGEKPR